MEIEVTPELRRVAQDLHRRRILSNKSGSSLKFDTTLAEVAALRAFDRDPQIGDLRVYQKSLQFLPKDLSGRDVRVIYRDSWPARVYSYRLDAADIFLFVVRGSRDHLNVAGWLPVSIVEMAPVFWLEEDGERVEYAHEIENGFPYPLPDQFDFTHDCGFGANAHVDGEYNGVWVDSMMAWECFGCGMYVYDEDLRESIASEHDEVPQNEEGD